MSQPLRLGYFNFQGRGQVCRLLLAYTKANFVETIYTWSNIADWTQRDKQQLELDFPSLPYLIDGRFKLTQSRAIEKYIIHRSNKADLLGRNSKEKAFIDNIDGVLRDVFTALISLFFAQNFQQQRKKTHEIIEHKFSYINACIGSKKHFLSRPTYPDFVLTVIFAYFQFYYPHEFSKWENIHRVVNTINNLPQILAYYEKSESVSALIAPEMANDPRFQNLKPINEESVQIEEVKPDQTFQEAQQPQTIDQSSQTHHVSQIRSVPTSIREQIPHPVQIQAQKSSTYAEQDLHQSQPIQIKRTDSVIEQKHFNARVEEYIKAAQNTNSKITSSGKTSTEKSTVVTPSKIQSSLNKSTLPWKIQDQQQAQSIEEISQNSSEIILGYWLIRGLGQVQRHLLTYCGHPFTEKIYMSREEWLNGDKNNLNLPFPNLPYLIHGGLKLTQSLAIDRYIIRTSSKPQLLGKNLHDETYIENIVKILSEIFAQVRVLCFTVEDFEKKKAQLSSKITANFTKMQLFIQSKQHAFGYLTWADFYIAQLSHYIEKIYPQLYDKFPFLKNIRDSVSQNSEIQKYYARDHCIKAPFMPPTAKIFF